MMKVIKTATSEIDSQNRQFIWTVYEDGSALSREIQWPLSCDAARRTKETWRLAHAPGSEMALMIARFV